MKSPVYPAIQIADLKKIIDGKLYDSGSAKLVADYDNYDEADVTLHVREMLYKTKNGSFFLVGTGHYKTTWSCYNSKTGEFIEGHALVPLNEEEAKQWLALRDFIDEYEKLFGLPEEA